MDFLDQVYLDNSIRSYLAVGAVVLTVVLFRRFLSRNIASLLFLLIGKRWPSVPKAEFINLVFRPLGWFLSCSIAIMAIDKLNFPIQWDWRIYGHSLQLLISKTGIAILVFSFTWVLLSIVNFVAFVLEQKALKTVEKSDEQLIAFIRDFLKVLIIIAGILMTLKAAFNQDIGSILTGLSIVGAALALAAKESLENLIASFIIFFNKPFFTGDLLKVNQVTGTVENIGLRSTRIRTADKTLITVPNKQMVDSVVDNWSMRTHRRAEIRIPLAVNTNAVAIRGLLDKIRGKLNGGNHPFTSSQANLVDLSSQGLVVAVEFLTDPIPLADFNELREEVSFMLLELIEEAGLTIVESGVSG